MSEPLLRNDRDDRGVVTLTLNRPQAFNALSEAMLTALGEAFDALADDWTVRAVVLGAAKAFCAGHDLKEMRAEPSLDYYQELFSQCTAVMLAIQRLCDTGSRAVPQCSPESCVRDARDRRFHLGGRGQSVGTGRRSHDGLQHDGAERTRGRVGLHRETPT